jgi:site-specific DNA-cytosine methylase
MYILENVKRILSNDKGRTWELIMNTLITMNRGAYHVDWKVLDTQEHGVPQSRPRVYIVGVLKTALPKDFQSFPWPEKLPLISIEPLLEEAERKPTMNTLPPSYPTTPYKGVKEVMDALHKAKQNPLCRSFLIDIDASPKFRSYMEDRVMCMTKSRPSGFWISSRGRRMTVDEMLRLQGMERCFEQVVSDKVLGAQIGNAMSQNILERLFIHLLPVAGLVPKSLAPQDRWLQRSSDPTWPRRVNEVKKVALKVKEAPKRQASCASRAAGSK